MLLFLLPWPPPSLATTEAKGRVGEPDMAQKIVSELHFRSSSVFGPSLALLLRIAACVLRLLRQLGIASFFLAAAQQQMR